MHNIREKIEAIIFIIFITIDITTNYINSIFKLETVIFYSIGHDKYSYILFIIRVMQLYKFINSIHILLS